MITVKTWYTYNDDKTSDIFHISAKGHARACRDENGNDLVCCAVSTLLQALVCSCAKVEGIKVTSTQEEGFIHISLGGESEEDVVMEALPRYTMVTDALEALSAQYPQCLEIS